MLRFLRLDQRFMRTHLFVINDFTMLYSTRVCFIDCHACSVHICVCACTDCSTDREGIFLVYVLPVLGFECGFSTGGNRAIKAIMYFNYR